MTTSEFPVPLAGPRDWRVPLARRLVLSAGWLTFAAGVGAGVAGLVMGITMAWAAPAGAALLALWILLLVPEPHPANVHGRDRSNRRRLRPEPIELRGLLSPPDGRRRASGDLPTSQRRRGQRSSETI